MKRTEEILREHSHIIIVGTAEQETDAVIQKFSASVENCAVHRIRHIEKTVRFMDEIRFNLRFSHGHPCIIYFPEIQIPDAGRDDYLSFFAWLFQENRKANGFMGRNSWIVCGAERIEDSPAVILGYADIIIYSEEHCQPVRSKIPSMSKNML